MRPGQNKRMRGRNNNNNNRKGPNPLTRSYESNGPDVKIRGTAHHIGEKYLQLARDAQSSGDPVMAESYLQHAEHYFRLIAAAQLAQQQASMGYQRGGEAVESDDDDADDDFVSLPDRFASPSERAVQPAPAPQQPQPQPYQDRQPYQNGGGQPYEARADRQFDRSNGSQQPYQDRHSGGDRPSYDNRNNRGDRQDRQGGGYQNNQDRGAQQERGSQDRGSQDRGPQDRGPYEARGNQDRPPRDYDNRNFRNNRGPRDFRDNGPRESREPRQPVVDDVPNGLPAFITGPTRQVTPEAEPQPALPETANLAPETGDENNFHMRPRRRRRPKPEFADGGTEGPRETTADDPVGGD